MEQLLELRGRQTVEPAEECDWMSARSETANGRRPTATAGASDTFHFPFSDFFFKKLTHRDKSVIDKPSFWFYFWSPTTLALFFLTLPGFYWVFLSRFFYNR